MSPDDVELAFTKFCDQATLSTEIVAAIGAERLVDVFVSEDADEPTVVRVPYNVTNEERASVNATVEAHSTLHGVKNARRKTLSEDCRSYIYRHYTQWQQASLTILLVEGLMFGYTQRMQYVGQALAWVKAVIGHYYEKKDEIDAAGDELAVEAVSWDFASMFDTVDPLITIREATSIQS